MFARKQRLAAVLLSGALTICPSLFAQHYTRTDLTQNTAGLPQTDSNLVNAWGLSRSSGSPWWISDNGTGKATLYDSNGAPQTLVVTMEVPKEIESSAPTGTIFNYAAGFEAATGKKSTFIFCTEEG